MADLNQSPVYFDHLRYLIKTLHLCHFILEFEYVEAVSNGRPINIYLYTIRLQNDIQNTILEINSFVHKISHV